MNDSPNLNLDDSFRTLPSNIEAEQAVLGALLVNNEVFDRLSGFLFPEHFYDPLHARIYQAAGDRIHRGQIASPVTLKNTFETDPAMQEMGGPAYLARLAAAAISVFNVRDYARTIHDLSVRRELIRLGEDIADDANQFEGAGDATEQISAAEQRLYSLAEKGRFEGGFQSFSGSIAEAIEVANAAYQRDGGLAGLSSGFRDMDVKLGGMHPSDLLILAGRPSMGKTALATNIAFHVARRHEKGERPDGTVGTVNGGVVGFFSLEMSAEQLATRILAEQSGIASEKIRKGEMTEEEFQRFVEVSKALQHAPLFIDDTPALPIATLAARARRLKRQHGLDLMVVDYLQLVRASATRGSDNRVQEVSEITQGLKAIAKELNVPVLALSQLSRQVESRDDKRPQLSDLRESGSIEQDADVVMFVFREEYYASRKEPREGTPEHHEWQAQMNDIHNLAEVIIGKQRHGPIGTIKLHFDSRFTRFGDLAREERYAVENF